jgi:hypothetical protein
MDDSEKLALIGQIVRLQADAQNDENGDRYQADAYLAVEAIEVVLAGDRRFFNGAVETYLPAEMP